MAQIEGDLARLDTMLTELEGTVSGAAQVSAAFQAELEDVQVSMRSASRDAGTLSRSLSTSLRRAFEGLIFDGSRLTEVLASVGRSITSTVLASAIKPVAGAISSAVTTGIGSLFGFADGAAFSSGRVTAFARGGVVGGPTGFPMRGGLGLMGEAGPEAILPLTRGSDGSLGVRAQGGGRAVVVNMNITTPDVSGFQKSSSQVAAQVQRAIGRGGRNL